MSDQNLAADEEKSINTETSKYGDHVCKFCEKSFRLNVALVKHIAKNYENHNKNSEKPLKNHNENIQKSLPTKTKMCDFCDQSFPKEELVKHLVEIHKINKLNTDIFGSKKSKIEIEKNNFQAKNKDPPEFSSESEDEADQQKENENSKQTKPILMVECIDESSIQRAENTIEKSPEKTADVIVEKSTNKSIPNTNTTKTIIESDLFSSDDDDEDQIEEDFRKQTADSKCKEYLEKCNAFQAKNNKDQAEFSSESEDETDLSQKEKKNSERTKPTNEKNKQIAEITTSIEIDVINEKADISAENILNVDEFDEEEIDESNFENSTGLNFKNNYGTSGITLDPILLHYKCDKCPFISETRYEGLKHVSKEHETQIQFPCDFCDMKLFTKKSLKIHMESVLKDGETGGKYKCDICDFKSCKITGITIHRKDAHSCGDKNGSKKQTENNIEIVINDSDSQKNSEDDTLRSNSHFDELIEEIKDTITGKKKYAFIKKNWFMAECWLDFSVCEFLARSNVSLNSTLF